MRFRHSSHSFSRHSSPRHSPGEEGIPTIDLIPMLTVMMGVLAFFVVVSVSLGSEQLIQVDLPPEQTEEDSPNVTEVSAEPFIVELGDRGEQRLNGEPIAPEQLNLEVQDYLARNPDKTVYLVPSRQLPYEQVMRFLGDMRAVGGDRISLALEEPASDADPSEATTP